MSKIRFVGLDVHADTIAVAVAVAGGEVRSHGVIPNRLESIRKLIGKLGPAKQIKACYEAGPTGYVARGETRVDARIGDPFDLFGTGGGSARFFVHSTASEVPESASLRWQDWASE
jgi:hypothetical protein